MKTFLRDTITTLLLAVVIFIAAQFTVQKIGIISGSMEPTLLIGQQLIMNKVVYKFRDPQRGDIIVFHPPAPHDSSGTPFIKRIIGLPGESVELKDGKVYIHKADGTVLLLNEPYIKEPAQYDFVGQKIPENEYFVLGDNRNNSGDSRERWTVPRENIIGEAWLSIWPISRWGIVTNLLQSKTASASD